MSVVCAWCHEVLSQDLDGPITHGICPTCAADLQHMPKAFDRFLDTLGGPVLVVDSVGRVMGANTAAATMVRMEPWDMAGKLGGDVLSCIYAEMPGGCGRTEHCTGCAIRRAYEHTSKTGEPVTRASAYAHRRGPDGPIQMLYNVSTERLGPLVLVEIDQAEADALVDPAAPNARH